MKKILIVFKTKENMEASSSIKETIKSIFAEYADIENVFLDCLEPDEKIKADILLLNNIAHLGLLVNHTGRLNKLFTINRSIEKKYLEKILDIPDESDVLVVNDDLESSKQTAEMLYWLGFTNMNFVAFDPNDAENPIYKGFEYAVTPEETHLVPADVKHVINIGYRKIGFDTIVQIKQALGVDNEDLNLKLFRYSSTILEPIQDSKDNYVNSYLKSRMLNDYIYGASAAMILINHRGQIVYSNHKAEDLFPVLTDTKMITLEELSPQLAELNSLTSDEEQILNKDDRTYLVARKKINLENIEVGYLFTIQDEADIKQMERTLNQKLIEKGLFARYTFNDILGTSDALKNCINLAKKAAKTDYTILINGESGVGKELFAQAIHNYSNRKDKPFVGVNCAAIPENLLESELFGYDSGAFTGANKKGKMGYFERANHGTIFLDEIGDVSAGLQSKLLRVLQERQIMRVGSDRVIDIDVRIVAATNKNLGKEVAEGNFRNDLYFRLNALQIRVPALRERKADIPTLFKMFMGSDYASVGTETVKKLQQYSWPGNVRELENCALYYKTLGQLPEHFNGGYSDIEAYRSTEPKTGETAGYGDSTAYKGNPSKPYAHDFDAPGTIMSDHDLDAGIKEHILLFLGRDNALGHGLGRTVILTKLKSQGFVVSDGQLRTILSQLSDEGLLTIGKGRQGTKITDLGIDRINNL
ncbi:MAG: sigma 54-interacting transcriptional regulator [Eubacteriaceae bacterium]|nr:sigma 54-interacting transcriptional regulator [Eubacteriaceae bacterium]